MKNYFSIGEISRQQNISRQTLIFYDKIGLLPPAYVDPNNGYRYYSAAQLDQLDTICIMKRIGFSLEEIREHMQSYTVERSVTALRKQLSIIEEQMKELQLIKSRVEHRCQELEQVMSLGEQGDRVCVERVESRCLLLQAVESPYLLPQVSLATKQCFVRSFQEKLPIYFQSGVINPYENIKKGRYVESSYAFLPIEAGTSVPGVMELPAGRCVSTYHIGDYLSTGKAYQRLLAFCQEQQLEICSDAYEFAINDYLSTGDENEYVTKILFYVRDGREEKR